MSDNPNAFKLKIGKAMLVRIADEISHVYEKFNRKKFLGIEPGLHALELKDRVGHVREGLRSSLPDDYPVAVNILLRSLERERLEGFDLWPYTDFVEKYGSLDPSISLPTLKTMTRYFTSEFAIRPFIIKDERTTLLFLKNCAQDENIHVRRWASEGTRPLLPWGMRLEAFVKDPNPGLEILEILKFDEELYVRKSVSNHLNDISKHHPGKVVQTLKRWKKEAGKVHQKKVDWIIHRALRTLIKKGYRPALDLIGAEKRTAIRVSKIRISKAKVIVGSALAFQFSVRSLTSTPQKLVIDYRLHFLRNNGDHSLKVFKLKSVTLEGGKEVEIKKAHSLKPITTRRYFPGVHFLEILVNGKGYGKSKWVLLPASRLKHE